VSRFMLQSLGAVVSARRVVTLVLAGFAVVTLGCASFFPDRQEALQPELWVAAAVAAE